MTAVHTGTALLPRTDPPPPALPDPAQRTAVSVASVIGGQVGFGDHARVQKGAIIGSKAGVLPGKIVRPGVWWGVPVIPLDEYKIRNAHLARLPQMREEIKELRKQLDELRNQLAEKK